MADKDYVTLEKLGALLSTKKNGLSFLHLNAQSARNKEDQITALISTIRSEPHVLMMTETWYRDESEVLRSPGYETFFLNRPTKIGGGVLMMAKNSVKCRLVHEFSHVTNDYEILTVQSDGFVYGVLYRPPSGNKSNFLVFLDTYLRWVGDTGSTLVLAGDLNIDVAKPSESQLELCQVIESNGFSNVITIPTRIDKNTATLIDMFITNIEASKCLSGVLSAPISDHLPIFMLINETVNCAPAQLREPIVIQDINEYTLAAFRKEISLTDWSGVYCEQEPEAAYDIFHDKLIRVYKKCFPYKQLKHTRKAKKPWLTKSCLNEIKRKNKLFENFLKNKNEETLKRFKAQRNKVNSLLRYKKRTYLNSIFNKDVMNKQDLAWSRLNKFLGRNGDDFRPTELVIDGDVICKDDLANLFNDYFVSLAKEQYNSACTTYLSDSISESAFLAPTTAGELSHAFSSVKNSTCCDAYDIQIKPIKHVLDIIAELLEHIFNLAFSTGIFPQKLQVAKVVVLYKGGDKNALNNYRPISILPVISKGLEKLIQKRMVSFLDKHHIITPSQFGFIKGRTTEHALLEQKEFILNAFERELHTLGIFVDYSKAFDTINHITLLKKCAHYGFRGVFLQLIESYLMYRQQEVVVGNCTSNLLKISAGVPQGSILGPLLFCIYINDIVKIDTSVKCIIYADDTTLLLTAENYTNLINDANEVLAKLATWTCVNCLKLNTSKTKAVYFRPKNKQTPCHVPLKLGSSELEIVQRIKCLGIIFDQHMSWNAHTEKLCGTISRISGILSRVRFSLPKAVKLLIYKSLFLSHVNYCHLVWGTTTLTNIRKLHVIQKRAVRAVANAPYRSHTTPIFHDMKLLPLPEYYRAMLVKRYQAGLKGDNLLGTIANLNHRKVLYNTRFNHTWLIPRTRTNYGKEMLRFLLPFHLNAISSSI